MSECNCGADHHEPDCVYYTLRDAVARGSFTPTPPSPEPPRCEHRGAFTGAQCIKPQGHNGEHFHDYIPSPEPPREREGEPCDICGRTKAMHQGPERFCPIIASYRAASLPPSAGTINSSRTDSSLIDAPPSAETREPVNGRGDDAQLYTIADGLDQLGYHGDADILRVIAKRLPSAPPAGSGETELDRLTAYIAGFIEAIGANPDDDGYAEAVAYATETASAWLAAHPAGPTSAGSGEAGRAYRELDEAMTMIDEQRGGIEGMRRNARIARQVIRTLAAHPAGTTRKEELTKLRAAVDEQMGRVAMLRGENAMLYERIETAYSTGYLDRSEDGAERDPETERSAAAVRAVTYAAATRSAMRLIYGDADAPAPVGLLNAKPRGESMITTLMRTDAEIDAELTACEDAAKAEWASRDDPARATEEPC